MANNRIFIRCNVCGEKLFLGKSFLNGFYYENYDNSTLEDKINNFYNKHTYCNDNDSDGDFDITYENENRTEKKKVGTYK